MKFNLKYLVLPLGIMVCISGNYSSASENNNNEEMQKKILAARNAYFTNHNFNGYNNNINNNNVINTESNIRNEQEQKQLKQRVSELIENMIENDNFYNNLTVDEQNEFKEVFGLDDDNIPNITEQKREILEKFEHKFKEYQSNCFFYNMEQNKNNTSESNVIINNVSNNYNTNALSKSNEDLKQRISNAAKFMNDEMLKDSHDEQIKDNFNKIIELQEKLENNINYIITQDDIEVLESMENYMNQTIINSRNTKQLLNNNSTDSSNEDINNNLDENLDANSDENCNKEPSYNDPNEIDPELLDRIKNAISFLRIKQKVFFNDDKTKSGYKEIDEQIIKFQELQEDMSNMNDNYRNDLNAIEQEMSTIDRNNITLDQLAKARYLLYYKEKYFDDEFFCNKALEFSDVSPNEIKKNNIQYYYLVNLLNENNKNKKNNTTNNTIYNFNEDIQQDNESQQYADETNNEIEDLRKKAQQYADNGDYEMMEYYNNQADELEDELKKNK